MLAVLLGLAAAAAPAQTLDRAALRAELAPPHALTAAFRQTQTFEGPAAPVVSTGNLAYLAPDRLRWETRAPYHVVLLLDGEAMTTRYPELDLTERRDLSRDRAAGFVMRWILAFVRGDLEALERDFRVEARRAPADVLELTLTPRAGPVARSLTRMRLWIADRRPQRVEMEGADGSRTTIDFADVALDPALAPDLFRPGE